jgi:hypothetical protein
MLEIHVIFPEQKDAYVANTRVCEFFQGSLAFIDNNIVVTPVVSEYIGDRKTWAFDICFSDEGTDHRLVITGGELLLQNGTSNVWAFSKVDNYVNRKDSTK